LEDKLTFNISRTCLSQVGSLSEKICKIKIYYLNFILKNIVLIVLITDSNCTLVYRQKLHETLQYSSISNVSVDLRHWLHFIL
jgi:hypothetical protein